MVYCVWPHTAGGHGTSARGAVARRRVLLSCESRVPVRPRLACARRARSLPLVRSFVGRVGSRDSTCGRLGASEAGVLGPGVGGAMTPSMRDGKLGEERWRACPRKDAQVRPAVLRGGNDQIAPSTSATHAAPARGARGVPPRHVAGANHAAKGLARKAGRIRALSLHAWDYVISWVSLRRRGGRRETVEQRLEVSASERWTYRMRASSRVARSLAPARSRFTRSSASLHRRSSSRKRTES